MADTQEFKTDHPATKFMALLGACITEWAWIEAEAYEICEIILGTAPEHTSIIFARAPTLDARLNLVDELMGTVFPKPEPGKHAHFDAGVWSKLLGEIKAAMPVRNQLAHSPTAAGVFGTMDEKTGVITKIISVEMLSAPHNFESLRANKTGKKPLLLADLEKHLETVRSLHERLKTFHTETLPLHLDK